MNKSLLLLFIVGLGLSVFVGGTPGILLAVLTVAAAGLLFSLRKFFPQTQAASAVGNLVSPSVGTAFAEHASTTGAGEVLLPYETYKVLRKRLLSSATTGLILLLLTLVGLRTLPVPAFVLFVPVLLVCILLLLFSSLSLLRLVPSGQRFHTLKTLFFADPRLVFAQYAARQSDGEVTVGYSTYKRRVRLTTYLVSTLAIIAFLVLAGEVQQAKNLSQENLDAASKQFQVLVNSVLSGQGDVKEQLGKLLAQSLQPAPTLDEKSLTNRILASVTKNLPQAPEQIVTTNVTEKTTTINRDFIDPNTTEAIKFGSGAILSYQSSNGTVFLKLGTGPEVTIPDGGDINIQGALKIDGTEVTATASDLNLTSNLRNTDQGNEGARYVGTRAADFTHFSPSRDDVQAALSAIDTSLGATTGSVSGFTPGSVLFANTDGTLTQDNTGFYYDKTNHRVGIGTTVPQVGLDVRVAKTRFGTAAWQSNDFNYTPTDGVEIIGQEPTLNQGNLNIYSTSSTTDSGGAIQLGAAESSDNLLVPAGKIKGAWTNSGFTGYLAFSTLNGSEGERMRIDSNGNVGIGTTTSGAKLSVMSGNVGIGTTAPGSRLEVATSNVFSTGMSDVKAKAGVFIMPAGYTMGLAIASDDSSGKPLLQGVLNSTTATDLSLNPYGGNVGIGTTAPGASLDVRTPTANTNTYLSVGTADSSYFADLYGGTSTSGFGALFWNQNATSFQFGKATTKIGGSFAPLMTILTTGGVGIGYTNPGGALSVNGNVGIGTTTPTGGLSIMNGNVGIGTTAPTESSGRIIHVVSSGRAVTRLEAGATSTAFIRFTNSASTASGFAVDEISVKRGLITSTYMTLPMRQLESSLIMLATSVSAPRHQGHYFMC